MNKGAAAKFNEAYSEEESKHNDTQEATMSESDKLMTEGNTSQK